MEEKMDYIMETMGLRKSYRGNVVVDNVNIHIPRGAVYGFVGPNGAGKSTVMKMVLNLIQPDAGEVHLFGEKVTDHSYEVFKRVGSIIENPYFYEKMTAWSYTVSIWAFRTGNELMKCCKWLACRRSEESRFGIFRWA